MTFIEFIEETENAMALTEALWIVLSGNIDAASSDRMKEVLFHRDSCKNAIYSIAGRKVADAGLARLIPKGMPHSEL